MNNRLGRTVLATGVAALVAAGATQAAELDYDYAELRFIDTEIDAGGGDIDGDGFEFGGSYTIADNVHVFGSYQTLDMDFDIDLTAFEIGAGYMMPLATGTDFVGRLSYINGEAEAGGTEVDDSGIGLSAGLRHLFAPQFEGRAFINYVDLDESGGETTFEVAGDYWFNDQFAAGIGLEFGDDTSSVIFGGRYYFGNAARR